MAWTAPRTWVASEVLTAALLNAHLRDNLNAAFPVGSLHFFMQAATTAATTIEGFALECNGTAVSRTTYAALNTKLSGLSYPFGSGDGSTTMNLPDLQGRTLVAMASGGHVDVNALGDSDALAKASRTPKDAAHTHTGPSHTHSTPSHSHARGTLGVVIGTITTASGTGASPGASGSYAAVGATATDGSGTSGAGGTGATGSGGGNSGAFLVPGVYGVKY